MMTLLAFVSVLHFFSSSSSLHYFTFTHYPFCEHNSGSHCWSYRPTETQYTHTHADFKRKLIYIVELWVLGLVFFLFSSSSLCVPSSSSIFFFCFSYSSFNFNITATLLLASMDGWRFCRICCRKCFFFFFRLVVFNSAHCQIHANCERQPTDRDIMDAPKQMATMENEHIFMLVFIVQWWVFMSLSLGIYVYAEKVAAKNAWANIERFVVLMYKKVHIWRGNRQ